MLILFSRLKTPNWTSKHEISFGANFFYDRKCFFWPKFRKKGPKGEKSLFSKKNGRMTLVNRMLVIFSRLEVLVLTSNKEIRLGAKFF